MSNNTFVVNIGIASLFAIPKPMNTIGIVVAIPGVLTVD